MDGKVPGLFLIEDINFILKNKGDSGVKRLYEMLPEYNLEKIYALRSYPLETELKVLAATAKIVYGSDSPEAWEKLGRHEVDTIVNSHFFKILLTLYGKDPVDVIKHMDTAFSFLAPFIKFTCLTLTEHKATFIIENYPYPKEYYLGIFKGFLEFYKKNGTVSVSAGGINSFNYTLTWD